MLFGSGPLFQSQLEVGGCNDNSGGEIICPGGDVNIIRGARARIMHGDAEKTATGLDFQCIQL